MPVWGWLAAQCNANTHNRGPKCTAAKDSAHELVLLWGLTRLPERGSLPELVSEPRKLQI